MPGFPQRPHRLVATGFIGTTSLLAAIAAILLAGCGGTTNRPTGGEPAALLVGHGARPSRGLPVAARLARRFALEYAAGAYHVRAPLIRGETSGVRRALSGAGTRVPADRRGLTPRLLGLRLSLRAGGGLGATASIGDGRFPPFSVGFTVARRDGRWLITSFEAPD